MLYRFLSLLICLFYFVGNLNVAEAAQKTNPKCEMWVTFYSIKNTNREGFEFISQYIEGNSNFDIVSGNNFKVDSFYNYCLDIIDNQINKEFESMKEIVFKPKATGMITVEIKDGTKLIRSK